jgi:CubicO group peptidase (beta-lactamase class C family)
MYDPYVSREMTIRDLLCHRSGLGPGRRRPPVFPALDVLRAEIVEKVRYLRPATSFRSRYAYDNILYIVAGEVVAAVSGRPWEAFVRERLLAPWDEGHGTEPIGVARGRERGHAARQGGRRAAHGRSRRRGQHRGRGRHPVQCARHARWVTALLQAGSSSGRRPAGLTPRLSRSCGPRTR